MFLKRLCILFSFLVFSFGAAWANEELRNFLLEIINAKEAYPTINSYHQKYNGFLLMDAEVTVRNKFELIDDFKSFSTIEFATRDFQILSLHETKKFTSVTYEYDFEMVITDLLLLGNIQGHTKLEKTKNSWSILFSAEEVEYYLKNQGGPVIWCVKIKWINIQKVF